MFNKLQKQVEDTTAVSNTIGKGTNVEGTIETIGNIRIEGKVVGDIKSKSKIVVGESCSIHGNLYAKNAEIGGEVKGKVVVTEMLILKPTSKIHGDINTNKLSVEAGATFNGKCNIGGKGEEVKFGEPKVEPKPQVLRSVV